MNTARSRRGLVAALTERRMHVASVAVGALLMSSSAVLAMMSPVSVSVACLASYFQRQALVQAP